jgi:hypothetical protein
MDQSGFDDLAKALSNSAGSRRRVLQLAAATLVGAPLLTLFPSSAAGGAKKRCKKKHGNYLTSGECQCGVTWRKGQHAYWKFPCTTNEDCACYETADGSGFCARPNVPDNHQGCESDAECNPGDACTVLPGYSNGASCTPGSCSNSDEGCVNGTCQYTSCRPACA